MIIWENDNLHLQLIYIAGQWHFETIGGNYEYEHMTIEHILAFLDGILNG